MMSIFRVYLASSVLISLTYTTKRLFPYALAFEGYFVLWGVLPHPTPKESMGFCLYPKTGCEFHL